MANANGKDLSDEVVFRINGRLTGAQVLPYINRGLYLLAAAGSFKWDMKSVTQTLTDGTYSPSSTSELIDSGKKIACANSPSGTPVRMVSQDEIGDSAAGYVDLLPAASKEYNTFYVGYGTGSAAINQAIIYFLPASYLTGTIYVSYHMLPPTLTYALTPTVRWDTKWLDDLVCDYAEAEISRILNLANWAELESRFKAKLMEAKKIYSTERETTGPPEEVQAAVQERDQVGRG